jgi:ABC-type antimicrobial peptide transport system permease subunit
MFLYCTIGFIISFIIGLIFNAFLLQGVTRERYLNDKRIRFRYGLLNWAIAILGTIITASLVRAGVLN